MVAFPASARAAMQRLVAPPNTARGGSFLAVTIGFVWLAGYLGVASWIACLMATASDPRMGLGTVLLAAIPGWLAVHQVHLEINEVSLGVLPMLPTVLLMLVIAVASARVASRPVEYPLQEAGRVVLGMGLAHGVLGAALASVLQGSVGAHPLGAAFGCASVAAAAAVAGIAGLGLVPLTPQWMALVRCAAGGALAVTVVGLSVLLLAVFGGLAAPQKAEWGASLFVLLLYLPNAVLAGWSVSAGVGVSLGSIAVDPFTMEPAVAGLLPPSTPSLLAWSFGAPVLAGIVVGWVCRRAALNSLKQKGGIALAGVAVVSVVSALLGWLAGGELGRGVLTPVSYHPAWLGLASFAWMAPPAVAMAMLNPQWNYWKSMLFNQRTSQQSQPVSLEEVRSSASPQPPESAVHASKTP